MIKITDIPKLTEEDKATLEKLKGSELFLIVLKIFRQEWDRVTSGLISCPHEELQRVQGFSQGIMSMFNNVLNYADVRNVDVTKKQGVSLQNGRIIRNMKIEDTE